MITLLSRTDGPIAQRCKVILDLKLADAARLQELKHQKCDIFLAAFRQKRKVGCIFRQIGGSTLFTYHPANQAQYAINLIAALSTLVPDFDEADQAGGGAQ